LKVDMTNPGEPRVPVTSVSLSFGDIVADRYRIDAVLGEGGMGVVYRAEHLHLRKPHAHKVLLPEWSSMPEVVARFEREAVAAGTRVDVSMREVVAFGPTKAGDFGSVEDALATAVAQASVVGRWDIVAQLARELEARRLSAAGVRSLSTQRLRRPTDE
jgi:hypothetical protein